MVDHPDGADQSYSITVRDDHDSTDTAAHSRDDPTAEIHSQQDSRESHITALATEIHEQASLQGEPASDALSAHSVPIVSVTEPQPALRRQSSSSSLLVGASSVDPPSPPGRPQSALADNPRLPQHRRDRRRSAMEFHSGRISEFFTNLMRREPVSSPLSSRSTFRDDRTQSFSTHTAYSVPPRAPTPPPRTVTPPPQFPPPSLQELGLSLTVVTADLSPSHFSTPPTSGAFLEPHYLLLCHAQGLDVLPLVSPPAQQPYALIRRVSFKSVVVMEHRGVLVAIAGRRDGVRVYALEDIKKAIEWRVDLEGRRERERMRREAARKVSSSALDGNGKRHRTPDRKPNARLSTPPAILTGRLACKTSFDAIPSAIPSTPASKKAASTPPPGPPEHTGLPPPYIPPPDRARQSNDNTAISDHRSPFVADAKDDWHEGSSDEEAINVVAAGASGSAALDERTSAMHSASAISVPAVITTEPRPLLATPAQSPPTMRRNRPANLDLSLSNATLASVAPPSPTPTIITLRQALVHCPPRVPGHTTGTPTVDVEDDDENGGGISLVQALLESRLPNLPPVGSRCPQQPILITPAYAEDLLLPRSQTSNSVSSQGTTRSTGRRRRRWSVLDGVISNNSRNPPVASATLPPSSSQPLIPPRDAQRLGRSNSGRSRFSIANANIPRGSTHVLSNSTNSPSQPPTPSPAITPTRSTFLTRIFANALHPRRSEDDTLFNSSTGTDNEGARSGASPSPLPPPKLEYVKLPGTKGALLVKAVETAKKSFLAILCGENGEKVELFAGTYRTALGLSRTFILPDSPRSLELQLQGDDLVEIFLVFNQNVFGLEPATVRVREVRIGRAERRAARRRARDLRTGEVPNDADNGPDDDSHLHVNVGVTVSVGSNIVASGEGAPLPSPPIEDSSIHGEGINTSVAHGEELLAVASAQAGPYTTFQQLSFTPKFPLASIADDYVIPPTYPEFLQYRAEHEPEADGQRNPDLAQIQFSPPGLPVPVSAPPSRWFYRDPKGIVHGPWKASLMQTWYKDSLLPPDLPVRKEGETEFTLLRDLRLQCVDPSHPFRSSPSPPNSELITFAHDPAKPLLKPISLLAQPRHFGPPALFYSSRGGHSTSIVDARGKSVLKGRFVWSEEHDGDESTSQASIRMGDVKHLEAFDVKDRAVLVAMRQGGLEAVDLGDALLRPGDESRTMLPQFHSPAPNTSRRGPFVWKIGTPVFSSPTCSTVLSSKAKGNHTRKHSTPASSKIDNSADGDDSHDDILFLGRKNDDLYMCERNSGSFRILRLCPQ